MVSMNFLFPKWYVGHDSSSSVNKKLEEESPVCVKQIYQTINIRHTFIFEGNFHVILIWNLKKHLIMVINPMVGDVNSSTVSQTVWSNSSCGILWQVYSQVFKFIQYFNKTAYLECHQQKEWQGFYVDQEKEKIVFVHL